MTKFKLTLCVATVLAMAGCVADREPMTVRSGPQAECPSSCAPGGKTLRDSSGQEIGTRAVIVMDNGVPMVAAAPMTTAASSPALAQTSASIFELIR